MATTPLLLADASQRLRGKPGRPPLSDGERTSRAEKRRAQREAQLATVTPRLLDEPSAAKYYSVTKWTIRSLEEAGILSRVHIPLPGNGELRKRLYDRVELDRLVDAWKERPA